MEVQLPVSVEVGAGVVLDQPEDVLAVALEHHALGQARLLVGQRAAAAEDRHGAGRGQRQVAEAGIVGGDPDLLLRSSYWNDALAQQWLKEADYIMVQGAEKVYLTDEMLESGEYVKVMSAPKAERCRWQSVITIYQRAAANTAAIDGSTGALTPVAGSPFATGITPAGIVISPNRSFLYVANQSTNNVSAFSVNAGTGALAPVVGAEGSRALATPASAGW